MNTMRERFKNSKAARSQQLNDRFTSLPKYVQEHIQMLERRLDESHKVIEASESNDRTLVYIDHYDRPTHFLPDTADVTFELTDQDSSRYSRSVSVRLRERYGKDGNYDLEITGHGGRSRMAVVPQSSNVVWIIEVPR